MKSKFSVDERMNMSLDEIIDKESSYNNTITYTNINDWIIHKDIDGLEYITGYRNYSNNLYETSNIREKIIMKDGLLIITKNDSFYKLPFLSSYY